MSTDRSSSAVRNLRSIFENKAPELSPEPRGRSSSGLTVSSASSRPGSRIRASFVSVEPMASLGAPVEDSGVGEGMAELKRESSAGLRRGSFSENDEDGGNLLSLKKTISEEAERRERDPKVSEAIPEEAAVSNHATPLIGADATAGEHHIEDSPLAHKQEEKVDAPPANPDKPVTAAEEEPAKMKPSDITSEAAVSSGEALPPVVEDLRKENEAPAEEGASAADTEAPKELETAVEEAKGAPAAQTAKPAPTSSNPPAKAPSTQLKTQSNKLAPSKPAQLTKKPSRSSLAAPTASSVARSGAAEKAASTASKSPPPKKREATKPIDLPSRLTAPTAASRARHEPAGSNPTPAFNGRASTTSRPKPATSSARPTPRTSLARPDSRSSQASKKPDPKPVDGGFLERMMRPTAASANRVHEKNDVKSPPRKSGHSLADKAKEKDNGVKKTVAKATGSKEHETPAADGKETEVHEPEGANGETNGSATPITVHGNGESNGALESTPAFGEETIR